MKKYLIIIMILIFSSFLTKVRGQTPTASATATIVPTSSQEEKEIDKLKEKIATKVAELKKQNQQVFTGYITKITDIGFKIKTNDDKEYEIKIDSLLSKLYQIVGTTKEEIKQKDLKTDLYVIITGPLIDKTVNANYIYADEEYFVGVGKITQINKDDLSFQIITTEKETYTLDVEGTTKQQMLNIKTQEIEKSGFSKLKEGDSLHFVFKKTAKDKDKSRFSAQRLFLLPQEYFIK